MPAPVPASVPFPVRCLRLIIAALLLAWLLLALWHAAKPLPPGTHVVSQNYRLPDSDVDFSYGAVLHPASAVQGAAAIEHAEALIVVDRSPLTADLADALLARKRLRPNVVMVVTTDPGNEAFGGTASRVLTSLEQSGIIVVRARLDRLRDSNPLYSGLWRLLLGWWSDPFDEPPGRVTPAAWARRQNFKADRRQLLAADDGSGGWTLMLAPAAGAAALTLRGAPARAVIASELQVAAWSSDDDRLPAIPAAAGRGVGSIDTRFLTEGAVAGALLDTLRATASGDQISIDVENLSERRIIAEMLRAAARGAHLQVVLARNAEPNRAVAAELEAGGLGRIELRWRAAAAVPNPALLLVRHGADLWVNWGAPGFTRRDLDDLNLAAGVELRMPARAAAARSIAGYFAQSWARAAADANFADGSATAYWRYRFAEATGLSSF
jgi:hypothetical protein